jgi:hypothetical protein
VVDDEEEFANQTWRLTIRFVYAHNQQKRETGRNRPGNWLVNLVSQALNPPLKRDINPIPYDLFAPRSNIPVHPHTDVVISSRASTRPNESYRERSEYCGRPKHRSIRLPVANTAQSATDVFAPEYS